MSLDAWHPANTALDRVVAAGRKIRFWLRDDDAVTVTPALDRLAALCAAAGMPILLAVIPADADEALAGWVAARASVTPCQHGYAHTNHAAKGLKACELGGNRPLAAVLDDLRRGRTRMQALFGVRLVDILVPPWNRIEATVVPRLRELGFSALSTFGAQPAAGAALVPRLDCDLDIMNWRNGRMGRDAPDVARKLAAAIEAADAAGRPIGLLTHHLAHDETAWAVLEQMLGLLHAHPAARITDARALLRVAHV